MIFFKRYQIKHITKKLKTMQQQRIHNQPSDAILQKEQALYHRLARIYHQLEKHKKFPFAEEMRWECLRASTLLNDMTAQFELASHLLEAAKFRDQLQKEGVFASTQNAAYVTRLYEEGLIYLEAAEKLGHIQAKRLHGLCYINGWGLDIDSNKGFELIVASIDQEQSWDKVPQIFAAIGLNKPEFFNALMKHRQKSSVISDDTLK